MVQDLSLWRLQLGDKVMTLLAQLTATYVRTSVLTLESLPVAHCVIAPYAASLSYICKRVAPTAQ